MPSSTKSGYFRNGLPYKRSGHGPRPLIIFQGLTFEHKPQAVMLTMYKFLENDYTLYGVLRKPQPPQGYTLGDMADDLQPHPVPRDGRWHPQRQTLPLREDGTSGGRPAIPPGRPRVFARPIIQ